MQQEELVALESIYQEQFSLISDQRFQLIFSLNEDNNSIVSHSCKVHIQVHENYPLLEPPLITLLEYNEKNLLAIPQLHSAVKSSLHSLFTPGEVVIFSFIEHLKSSLLNDYSSFLQQSSQSFQLSSATVTIEKCLISPEQRRPITTQRGLLLLMGGTLYDESSKEKRLLKRMNSSKGTLKDKETVKLDLKRHEEDFTYIKQALTGKLAIPLVASKKKNQNNSNSNGNGVECFDCIPPQLKTLKPENLKILQSFFNTPANHYLIYWSGHGELDTGDWCFSASGAEFNKNDKITCKELIDCWKSGIGYANQKQLTIISDSCHSGAWKVILERECQEAQVASIQEDEDLKQNQQQQEEEAADNSSNSNNHLKQFYPLRIAFQAGCQEDEESWLNVIDSIPNGLEKQIHLLHNSIQAPFDQCFAKPASLLMRKLIYDMLHGVDVQDSTFVWPFSRQKPVYYISPNYHGPFDYLKVKQGMGEVYSVIRITSEFKLRFTEVSRIWKVSIDGKQASYYASPNEKPFVIKGNFHQDFLV